MFHDAFASYTRRRYPLAAICNGRLDCPAAEKNAPKLVSLARDEARRGVGMILGRGWSGQTIGGSRSDQTESWESTFVCFVDCYKILIKDRLEDFREWRDEVQRSIDTYPWRAYRRRGYAILGLAVGP